MSIGRKRKKFSMANGYIQVFWLVSCSSIQIALAIDPVRVLASLKSHSLGADVTGSGNLWPLVQDDQSDAPFVPYLQNHVWEHVTLHNSSLPPLAIKNPECLGLLHQLDGSADMWVQRYCILKDGCLYFYTSIRSTQASGMDSIVPGNNSNYSNNSHDILPWWSLYQVLCFELYLN